MSSDEEVFNESEPAQKLPPTDATYVVPSKSHHPPYFQMVEEAIFTLSKRSAVSRPKINDFIKTKYEIVPIPNFVTKALKKGIEENAFENTTASGAAGSFKITKEHKETMNAKNKTKSKKDNESKSQKSSKTDDTAPKSKKPPSGNAAKNKENKAPKKNEKKGNKETEEKVKKTLKKSHSTGSVREKVASVSKALPTVNNEPTTSGSKKRQKKNSDK